MAETKEIVYIPYGENEIDSRVLQENLANNTESYLNSKRWAKKEKNRKAWLEAYNNILSGGIAGASVVNGIWNINHNGNIDLESMTPKEREIYEDVAHYILLTMSLMTPRKKEEEKKSESKKFNFDWKTDFLNKYYGGDREVYQNNWLTLNLEDRKNRMIDFLTNYKNNLKDESFSFEGTPFLNIEDLKERLDKAITSLLSPDTSDDSSALAALGIDYSRMFTNGENAPIKWIDSSGNEHSGTQDEYNTFLEQEKKPKKEIKKSSDNLSKMKQNIATYRGIYGYSPLNAYNIGDFNFQNIEDAIAHIKNNFANIKTNDEFRKKANEIVGVYSIIDDNKKLKEIPENIWNILLKSQKFLNDDKRGKNKSDFRKLEGINNIVFDTTTKKVYYLDSEKPTKKMLDTVKRYRNKQIKEKTKYLESRYSGPTMITHKQGGQINFSDKIIKDFIINNNI